MSSFNPKDAGAFLGVVGGGGARGVAAGTGDATEAVGEIVDQTAEAGLTSGLICVFGTATLQDTETLSLTELKIEHGDESDLSDAEDYEEHTTVSAHADIVTGDTGGTTELVALGKRVNFQAIKRYWRVSVTPDLSASATDVFTLGFGVVAVGEEAPLTS